MVASPTSSERAIGKYIERYPEATVINIGAGLDTTFSRVANGKMRWYDLDLPVRFVQNGQVCSGAILALAL
jgi:hypothetical protein